MISLCEDCRKPLPPSGQCLSCASCPCGRPAGDGGYCSSCRRLAAPGDLPANTH